MSERSKAKRIRAQKQLFTEHITLYVLGAEFPDSSSASPSRTWLCISSLRKIAWQHAVQNAKKAQEW
jgi:hypothetical protein